MSLRSSLIVSIVVVVVFTLIFGAAISYWHALSKVEEEMEAAIAVGGRIAGNAVDDADEVVDPRRRLELLVADFHGDRHLRAMWINRDGRSVVSSKPAEPTEPAPEWFHDLIRQPERTLRVNLPTRFTGLGTFVLKTDSRNEIGEVWNDIWNTLTILGVFCGLVVGIVYWMLGRALKPLDRLADAFTQVGNGTATPQMPERGPVEFARVFKGFNLMAERLSKTEARNRQLHEQLATVQEEERADLARDLHDEIGPFLFSVDVDAGSIGKLVRAKSYDKISARVATIRESIGHMQSHVKELLVRLRAAALLDVGLVDAIDNLINFWKARYPGVQFNVDIPDESHGELIDGTVFRVVQESLSNALRHGQPKLIEVVVKTTNDEIHIEVSDDGSGLGKSVKGSGYGISGMRERVSALSGAVNVSDRADRSGVVVKASIPIAAGLSSDDCLRRDTIGENPVELE